MIKHICIIAGKRGGGSYGLGDTQAEAQKIARSELGGDTIREKRFRTAEVPPGHHVEFQPLPTGVEWHVVPDAKPQPKPQPPPEKPVRHYRVPYRLHTEHARTKAQLATAMTSERLKKPDIHWIEFDAPTHAEAQRQLQALVLPGDDRKIMGRNYVSLFSREPTAEEVHFDRELDAI
jgi:hypothetical protein